MNERFKDLYQCLPSPVPAAIELLRHIFVSPSTILAAPLSNPVVQRLQWIPPSPDDVNESYLYFNNMIDQGASGRIHQLRLEMIYAGPSCWQVCKPEQVEYKVDEKNLESLDGFAFCEMFARVTVWKNEDDILDNKAVDTRNKLGIILKLEADDLDGEHEDQGLENNGVMLFRNKRLSWKYFDLQDLVTPGLDSRPWFKTIEEAASRSDQNQGIGVEGDEQEDYWVGYSSSSEEGSRSNEAAEGRGTMDPTLRARIQNTPLYRSKAPSVSSVDSAPFQVEELGPADLLSRISRTPLYKRAPSLVDDPLVDSAPNSPLDHLLKAAEIVNLSKPSSSSCYPFGTQSCPDTNDDTRKSRHEEEKNRAEAAHLHAPVVPLNNEHPDVEKLSVKQLEENVLNSLRSTFSLYKFSLDLIFNDQKESHGQDTSSMDPLNSGERFVAFAHRVVLDSSSKPS